MHKISKARFDALAAFSRRAGTELLLEEVAWFASDDERVIAVAIRDTDDEFSGQLLARDRNERYRWVTSTGYHTNVQNFMSDLRAHMAAAVADYDKIHLQGDESGVAVDFFTPVRKAKRLNPSFKQLAEGVGFVAARRMINELMRWHDDVDGNFVEQFQTSGFDQRMWELYLFAALKDAGLDVSRPDPAPDFLVTGPGVKFAVEAVTANPTLGPDGKPVVSPRHDPGYDEGAYRRDYLPLKYAGPLMDKLKKQYWTKPAARGIPLVFAIQDFHDAMSMTFSGSALPTYLYGYTYTQRTLADGSFVAVPEKVTAHLKGSVAVPSGFFFQPDAENVSAVIFNASGTISKFNRMGVLAGFGLDDVTLVVSGFALDPTPGASAPVPFSRVVDADYTETWIDGMDVYHNPRALRPLPMDALPGATHHAVRPDGSVYSVGPEHRMWGSVTHIVVQHGVGDAETGGSTDPL